MGAWGDAPMNVPGENFYIAIHLRGPRGGWAQRFHMHISASPGMMKGSHNLVDVLTVPLGEIFLGHWGEGPPDTASHHPSPGWGSHCTHIIGLQQASRVGNLTLSRSILWVWHLNLQKV